jgi:hypothetical protein
MLKKKDVKSLQIKNKIPEYDFSVKQCSSPPKRPAFSFVLQLLGLPGIGPPIQFPLSSQS